jgi:hypothetical protein
MLDRYQRSFILPNYTPSGWFECDVFEITSAGFFREYEVKLTRSDFRADAEKVKVNWRRYKDPTAQDHRKHDMLKAGDARGPAQFWYVCPPGVLSPEIVPEWAGLIVARPIDRLHYFNCAVEVAKPAPRLHRSKLAAGVESHARGVCYWRLMKKLMERTS